jgi:phospholipid/cholesterol/gamma-HCH transport system permease protein
MEDAPMSRTQALGRIASDGPFETLGRTTRSLLEDIGGAILLALAALRSIVWPKGHAPNLIRAVGGQIRWNIAAGLPVVGLAHIGIGSFLSMQAFFGATFVEGTGAVVGVGLVRNVAPLLTGFIVAAMAAVRTVHELRENPLRALDNDTPWVADRDISKGLAPDPRPDPDPARIVLARLLGAMIAAPVLSVWGAAVGITVGWQVASSLLGVPTALYFGRFAEMLWPRDLTGLVFKACSFAFIGAIFACREGLRREHPEPPLMASSLRALCWAMPLILAINLSWFFFNYIIGPAWGPTLLEPPSPK